MTFTTTKADASTQLHVVTYAKGDVTNPDVLYITIPELGAAISVTSQLARQRLPTANNAEELFVRFITHAVDLELREQYKADKLSDAMPVPMALAARVFMSDVGPADQSIIKDCRAVSISLIGCSRDAELVTFPDAVFTPPTLEEAMAQMPVEQLLAQLGRLLKEQEEGVEVEPAAAPRTLH